MNVIGFLCCFVVIAGLIRWSHLRILTQIECFAFAIPAYLFFIRDLRGINAKRWAIVFLYLGFFTVVDGVIWLNRGYTRYSHKPVSGQAASLAIALGAILLIAGVALYIWCKRRAKLDLDS